MQTAELFDVPRQSADGNPREARGASTTAANLQEDISAALNANLERGYLESEERFRQIVEGLTDAVWLTNVDGTQVFLVNAAYESIWGEPRETLYADPLAFLRRVHPDDVARVRETMSQPLHHDIEYRIVRPTGDVRWVWSRGYPVLDHQGHLYRVGTLVEDITERRQIRESHERLIRGFTHDIKNPLGAADGYMALLEMGIHGALNGQQQENVRRARGAIRSALSLVIQLLAIERAQSGQLAVQPALTDIEELTRDTAAGFRPAATARNVAFEVLPARPGESISAETDQALVRQILANLMSNAVKYTQPGGHVSVRVNVANDGQAPWPGRWVAVEVADDGPGIPVAKQRMLFREFTRFDPSAAEGTGLGLAISQRMATALGATITFESTPDVGSTFTLWIPFRLSPPREA